MGCDGLVGALGGLAGCGGRGSGTVLFGGICLRVIGGEGCSYWGDIGGEGMMSPDMGCALTTVISGLLALVLGYNVHAQEKKAQVHLIQNKFIVTGFWLVEVCWWVLE